MVCKANGRPSKATKRRERLPLIELFIVTALMVAMMAPSYSRST